MGHIIDHPVTDTHEDKYFQINPVTREIVNTGSTKKLTLIKGDHNSEVFTFEVPRIIEGHDMSLCNQVTVHFINIGTNKQESENVYTIWKRNVDDVEPENGVFFDDNEKFGVLTTVDEEGKSLEPENQVVVGTWLISRAATTYRGTLSFVVRFECLSKELVHTLLYEDDVLTLINGEKVTALENSFVYEDGTVALDSDSDVKSLTLEDGRTISLTEDGYPQVIETTFPVDYSWSSAIYSKIIVADTHENVEQTLEPYNDVLEAWWDKICQASDTLYAITDDGVLLDVTEKVNGLESNVTELRETVESLAEIVEDNKEACDKTLESANAYTDTEVSSLDDSIQAELTTIKLNHSSLHNKVNELPTTSTTLYKHDVLIPFLYEMAEDLELHYFRFITNNSTPPDCTSSRVKITGEIIQIIYGGLLAGKRIKNKHVSHEIDNDKIKITYETGSDSLSTIEEDIPDPIGYQTFSPNPDVNKRAVDDQGNPISYLHHFYYCTENGFKYLGSNNGDSSGFKDKGVVILKPCIKL